MADYRQECSDPNCRYTGFTGHSPGCLVQIQSREREKKRRELEKKIDDAWEKFSSLMDREEVFKYYDDADKMVKRMHVYENRRRRAMEHMRRHYLTARFFKWRQDE